MSSQKNIYHPISYSGGGKKIADEIGLKEFNVSHGWLWRFKTRHEIIYKKACGEKTDADVMSAEVFLQTFTILLKITYQKIFITVMRLVCL